MKPWVRISENTFEFCNFDAGYEAVQAVKDSVLSKVLTFQIHELKTLRVVLPFILVDGLLEVESFVEGKITPVEVPSALPPPPIEFSYPENFIVPGIPLVRGLHLNFDFGFREGDFERFDSIGCDNVFNFADFLHSLDTNKKVLIGDRDSFLQTLTSFYRSVYPQESFDKIAPLIQMSASYGCFALPCLSQIKDRETLERFWNSTPTDGEIKVFWELSTPSHLSFEEKLSLPFDLLFSDYLVRRDGSPYLDSVLRHTKRFFYGYQLFMTLTCFRMMLSCVFSTPFKEESSITRVFPDLNQPESFWNLFRSDKSLGFLLDESFYLDFNFSDDNEQLYSRILDTYGHERIKQMWVNVLGERLPTAAGLKVVNPKKTLSEIFDNRMLIHRMGDWKSFLDDPDFGLVWSITYNTAPKLRHEYRRIMVNHFVNQGGISL